MWHLKIAKHFYCEENCADYFLKLNNLDDPGIEITNEKWLEIKQGYNNISFDKPIYASKGSLIILRQNNTGKIVVDRSGNAAQSDVLVNCAPKCLTAKKLNENSNWRFSIKINYNTFKCKFLFNLVEINSLNFILKDNVFYGQPIPSSIEDKLIVTNSKKTSFSYTPGAGFFLLNNAIIKEDSFVDRIEFYAANPGSISIGVNF